MGKDLTFYAAIIRQLIDGRNVDGHLRTLPDDWRIIAEAIHAAIDDPSNSAYAPYIISRINAELNNSMTLYTYGSWDASCPLTDVWPEVPGYNVAIPLTDVAPYYLLSNCRIPAQLYYYKEFSSDGAVGPCWAYPRLANFFERVVYRYQKDYIQRGKGKPSASIN